MAETVTGVITKTSTGNFILRDPSRSFRRAGRDIIVPFAVARSCALCNGAAVVGSTRSDKGLTLLAKVESIAGLSVEDIKTSPPSPLFSDSILKNQACSKCVS